MIPPDSPQWIPARVGCLSASQFWRAVDRLKTGKPSKECINYMHELVAERLTNAKINHYVTPAMEHGLQYEAAAAEAYEALSGNLTASAGWFLHPTIEHFGATPDRLLDDDGLVEIKCPTTTTYIAWRRAGVVPQDHVPQMLAQLAVTGRRYCDFVAYDPRVQDPALRLFVRRFEPTTIQLEVCENEARQFLAEVDALFEAFTTQAQV